MSKKNDIRTLMNKRNPLTQRDVVEPAEMYTSLQVDKATSGQDPKNTTPLVSKYTTHLRPETIKAIKRRAFETEHKDYEIVQAALDAYLAQ